MTGLTKVIAKEWGPQFGVRANTVAFGYILTRLTASKEDGAFVTAPDGSKIALGIPKAQLAAVGGDGFADIPLRRAGTATEAASAVLAVASPLFSYVNGETIMVSGVCCVLRPYWSSSLINPGDGWKELNASNVTSKIVSRVGFQLSVSKYYANTPEREGKVGLRFLYRINAGRYSYIMTTALSYMKTLV